ncbi:hypothetical protein HGA88_05620 [Candidatus Roizmanbacteria bacterium]|nr:hypothetical protein [Candidatus Roizmanbacteria bacterium]
MHILLVDLDDTIIDTVGFKKAVFQSVVEVTKLSLDEVTRLYLKSDPTQNEWYERFAAYVQSRVPSVTSKAIVDRIFQAIQNILVNTQVLSYIARFEGYKVLFTLGDAKIQEAKIQELDLKTRVDEVYITQTQKINILADHIRGHEFLWNNQTYDQVTIIDNNLAFLNLVHEQYPWITAIDPKSI